MRSEIPLSIFNVPASCLPSSKPAPRPAKVEDQQLRYFLQKDKITSFDAFKPERNLQKQYKNLIISRSKERLVCLFMTDNFTHTSAYVDTEEKKLVFLTRQLELLSQTQFSMNDYCFALQSYPKCNNKQLRDFLVLPCHHKLQYITSSIDNDQTAHTVGFALYLLARNQKVQEGLQQKVDAVVKRNEPLTPEHIVALDCVVHTVKETLRLYHPNFCRLYPLTFAHVRILTENVVMSGYRIPAKTVVVGFHSVTSRMEEYFRRPLEFLPERWQRDRPHGQIHPFASLPFSHGTRMCIGKRLAEQEIYTFLIRMLQRYTVTYESSEEMEVRTELILKPTVPLNFKFHPRN
ncbi:Cytochrome P450 [Trinorchestia longiramus]|nr:Cytochrome P450 [Trinorchestia longiramus]